MAQVRRKVSCTRVSFVCTGLLPDHEKPPLSPSSEVAIVEALGIFARFQLPGDEHAFDALSTKFIPEEDPHANDDEDGRKPQDGGDPSGASGETDATPSSEGSDRAKPELSVAAERLLLG
jgi:hypothetical protein